jgi:hypothetical protein
VKQSWSCAFQALTTTMRHNATAHLLLLDAALQVHHLPQESRQVRLRAASVECALRRATANAAHAITPAAPSSPPPTQHWADCAPGWPRRWLPMRSWCSVHAPMAHDEQPSHNAGVSAIHCTAAARVAECAAARCSTGGGARTAHPPSYRRRRTQTGVRSHGRAVGDGVYCARAHPTTRERLPQPRLARRVRCWCAAAG